MSEDYPGQAYVHEHNPNIKRAEENAMSEQRAGRGEGLAEAIERVKLMAMGDDQWDLSENDMKALKLLLAALEAAPAGTAHTGQDFEQLVWRANDLLDRAKEAMECDPEADNVGGDCWTWIKQTEIWLEELNRGAALATPSPQAPDLRSRVEAKIAALRACPCGGPCSEFADNFAEVLQ